MSGCELEVTVTKAEKLPITPLRIASSKINCNSYVEVTCGPDKFTTGVIRHNTSPTYDKVHKFTLEGPITDSTEPVVVKVFHKGRVGSNLIGRCDIPLGALRGTRLDNKFYQLKGQSGKAGRISIQLKYTDPNPPSASSAAALASNGECALRMCILLYFHRCMCVRVYACDAPTRTSEYTVKLIEVGGLLRSIAFVSTFLYLTCA